MDFSRYSRSKTYCSLSTYQRIVHPHLVLDILKPHGRQSSRSLQSPRFSQETSLGPRKKRHRESCLRVKMDPKAHQLMLKIFIPMSKYLASQLAIAEKHRGGSSRNKLTRQSTWASQYLWLNLHLVTSYLRGSTI